MTDKYSWYDSDDWTPEARELFELKLRRARGQRPQYMRIKGCHLSRSNDPEIRQAGIQLLLRLIEEHPDDRWSALWSLDHIGDAFRRDHHFELADKYYRKAIELYESGGGRGPQTWAYMKLAEAIAEFKRAELYDEAERLLDDVYEGKASCRPYFQSEWFRYCLARARIASELGRTEEAAAYASRAIQLSSDRTPRSRSGLGKLGFVQQDAETMRELARLAETV